ncbi:MAG: glycoside hydrolase family 130 protein [Vulcanimicrobiaceae bacterium]
MGGTHDFSLEQIEPMSYSCAEELAQMYKLSPFVWRERDRFEMLLRVVNRSEIASEKVARIHRGRSADGLHFVLDPVPVIAPGDDVPDALDSGGCEDPSVARVDGRYYVYYTGWNEHLKRGELLLASGPDLEKLEKRGIALASTAAERNPKEAEIVRAVDGSWRLFFEYAHEDRSKIGIAAAPRVDGPWKVLPPLFAARPGWDDWHLSTGPVIAGPDGLPVMFYNGASRAAEWRIGWVVFDRTFTTVVARCENPIVLPGERRFAEDTDIAFAASAVERGNAIDLYYSIADRHVMRARVRQR